MSHLDTDFSAKNRYTFRFLQAPVMAYAET